MRSMVMGFGGARRTLVVASALTAYALLFLALATTTQNQADFNAATSQSEESNGEPPTTDSPAQRNFTISIWRVGKHMERRFLRSFGDTPRDPFEFCSVRNCRLEANDSLVEHSDAVMFHLHLLKNITGDLPPKRPSSQQWIFFTDESPYHTFMSDPRMAMKKLNGIFNLSMTYRADSDIPVPYGRTVKLAAPNAEDFEPEVLAKTKGVTVLASNCGGKNQRWDYIRELGKHIEVDVFGKCGKVICPGHFKKDCDVIKDYQFYLAFENSNCAEYLTEKLWYNSYSKKSIPIVMGGSRADYARLCPPNSFIHVEDFASPQQLADHIRKLQSDPASLLAYHAWRKDFEVVNESGYFGSPSLHVCRMCEALNRLNRGRNAPGPQTLGRLEDWWSVKRDCRPAVPATAG